MFRFTEEQIAAQFWQSMEDCEIQPRDTFQLIMDGQIHRFAVRGDRYRDEDGAGVYFIHADGWPNWGIMDHHRDDEFIKYKFNADKLSDAERERARVDDGERLTPEQWREIAKRKEAERKREEAERRKQAFEQACREYASAVEGDVPIITWDHPYLKERFTDSGIIADAKDFDLFYWSLWGYQYPNKMKIVVNPVNKRQCERGDLLVPLSDARNGHFRTLQIIKAAKDSAGKYPKRFFYGVPIKNTCYEIRSEGSDKSPYIFLCEGVCTGLAVKALVHRKGTIYCAMDCGNLEEVARSLRSRYPGKKIILMADNDGATFQKREFNPGIDAANKLLKKGLVDKVNPAQIGGRENQNVDWYDVLATRIISGRSKPCL